MLCRLQGTHDRRGRPRRDDRAVRDRTSTRGARTSLEPAVEAEQHFQSGVSQAEAQRLPIQHGVCLQGLAEVAERSGEREQAMEYLDRASELFSRHNAKLYLDQVLAKREILKA